MPIAIDIPVFVVLRLALTGIAAGNKAPIIASRFAAQKRVPFGV